MFVHVPEPNAEPNAANAEPNAANAEPNAEPGTALLNLRLASSLLRRHLHRSPGVPLARSVVRAGVPERSRIQPKQRRGDKSPAGASARNRPRWRANCSEAQQYRGIRNVVRTIN